jgi:ADP-heptose:LPS heptosyltransferase
VKLPIDLASIRRLLLLRTDRLGDMVVTSSLVHRIRQLHPTVYLGMVVSGRNLDAARLVDGIDALHVIGRSTPETMKSIQEARSQKYDVVLNLVFNRTTLGGILSNLISPKGIKVGQGAEKYRFYFNAMVGLERGTVHMAEILESYGTQTFGPAFAGGSLDYALKEDASARTTVEAALGRLATPPTVLNLSAGHPDRSMSSEQAIETIRGLLKRKVGSVVVTSAPGQAPDRSKVVRIVDDPRVVSFPASGNSSFSDLVELVRLGQVVITPDTSLVHIAGATKTPLVALFVDPFAHAEWHPRNTRYEEILGDPNRPLSAIPADAILQAYDRLMSRGAQ